MAQRSLDGRELETVGNLVGEIARGEAIGLPGRGRFTRRRLAFLETDSQTPLLADSSTSALARFESSSYNF